MRLAAVTFALVASVQCFANAAEPVTPTSSVLKDAAAKKAVEELVAVPIGEMWKDLYDALVRQKGSKALRKMRYMLAGLVGSDARALAKHIMDKMKEEVFDGSVNQEMWDALTMELYFLLKEWWSTTPENPREAADLGSWQALVTLFKHVMAPSLRGSNRISPIKELLLDPELTQIKSWVEEWKGVSPSKTSASTATSSSTGKTGE